MAVSPRSLKWASVLFGLFGALRLAASSGIAWVRNGAAPYAPLEYPLLFGAVFLWFYGLTMRPRIALFIAMVSVVLYFAILLGGVRNAGFAPSTTNFMAVVLLEIATSGSEELLFRGALFSTGPWISSAVFAAFHAFVYGVAIIPLVFAFAAGLAF